MIDYWTVIERIKGTWNEVLNDCRVTVGKPTTLREPSSNFKISILIAEHSPIRDLRVRWTWKNIPSWVATHWSRHKFEKYIKTQRSDRTGVSRDKLSQDNPVDFTGEANAQSLIDVWRKRLCIKCSTETRKYAVSFKKQLRDFDKELSSVLVPNCVYRGGCPELGSCGWYEETIKKHPKLASTDIKERYDEYNRLIFHTGIRPW